MRTLRKRSEPQKLTEWRAAQQVDPLATGINFGYDLMRQDVAVTKAVTSHLVEEQGGICAYTGHRISEAACHIEHLKAQTHCQRGEDVDYRNMVACWPAPNTGEARYGAHQKKDWPDPQHSGEFVSPLSPGCEQRFMFRINGKIRVLDGDAAASTTVCRLKLGHKTLDAHRMEAIDGLLGEKHSLSLSDARKALRRLTEKEDQLDRGGAIGLPPFSFALRGALEAHIRRLEGIRKQDQL